MDLKRMEAPYRFDLNLVRVLVAVYETGSVTQAAARLCLTQPTISHSLSKLRRLYDDRLFSRGPQRLVPTLVCERIYEQLSGALAHIESTVEAQCGFDPSTSNRRFRIAVSDIGAFIFTPVLLRRFKHLAPHAQLEFVQLSSSLDDGLATGALDLAIGNLPGLHARLRNELLFCEHYVCLVAAEHAGQAETMDLARFTAGHHVMVTASWSGHAQIDHVITQCGIHRNIVALVPQFSALPALLERSELMAVLPERLARLYASQGTLKVLKLPVRIPEFEVRVHWHARNHSSRVHQWLRTQVLLTLSGL